MVTISANLRVKKLCRQEFIDMTSYSTISNATDIEAYAERINGMLAVHNASGQYLVATDAWHALTLSGTWANVGSGSDAAAYALDLLGWVVVKGFVTSGGATTIAVLPSGYRPSQIKRFATTALGAFGTLVVDTSGNITLPVGSFTNVSINMRFSRVS
jgi:hypothetical protein